MSDNDKGMRDWVKRILGSQDTRVTITEARTTTPQEKDEDRQMLNAVKSLFQDDEGDTRLNLGDDTPKPYSN